MKANKLLLLVGAIALGGVSFASAPLEAVADDTAATDAQDLSEEEKIFAKLSDLWGSNNYTMEWSYEGVDYVDIITEDYIALGNTTSALVALPSVDGAYERVIYNAIVETGTDGSKDISLGTAATTTATSIVYGDGTIGSSTARFYNPMSDLTTKDPLCAAYTIDHSAWGASLTVDKIVDLGLGDGSIGVLGYSAYNDMPNTGIYTTLCAALGFYSYTTTYGYYINIQGRFSSVANAASAYVASNRPYGVKLEIDDDGDLVASVLLSDGSGGYYVPDGGSGTFVNVGTTADADFEDFIENGEGNISKKTLATEQAANIVGREFSSTTDVTAYYQYTGGALYEYDIGTYYLDYNTRYLKTYSEDDMDGTIYFRGNDGSASYVLLTGANEIERYDAGDDWLDWAFAYEFMDLNSWRYVSGKDVFRYYGCNATFVYNALTGIDVPSVSGTSLSILSLEITLKDNLVDKLVATTSGYSTTDTDGNPATIYATVETTFEKEVREIVLPTVFDRDDSYDAVKAAFDRVNDTTQAHKTTQVQHYASVEESNAQHTYTWYTEDVVYIEKILNQSGGSSSYSAEGYYLRRDEQGDPLGVAHFTYDSATDSYLADTATDENLSIEDYWGYIKASPDVMTWNEGETGFELKGAVHLLPSYFPTLEDPDSSPDSVSNLTIDLNTDGTIAEIEYNYGGSLDNYGSYTGLGHTYYDYEAALPDGLLEELAEMEEFTPPSSWDESVATNYSGYANYMNNFINALNDGLAEEYQWTVADLPYVYDLTLESGNLYTYYSSYSRYIEIYSISGTYTSSINAFIEMFDASDDYTYNASGSTTYLRRYDHSSGRLYASVGTYTSAGGFCLRLGIIS